MLDDRHAKLGQEKGRQGAEVGGGGAVSARADHIHGAGGHRRERHGHFGQGIREGRQLVGLGHALGQQGQAGPHQERVRVLIDEDAHQFRGGGLGQRTDGVVGRQQSHR